MNKILIPVVMLVMAITATQAEDTENIPRAEQATLTWLALTDQGQYEQSWTDAAALFRAAVSQSDWIRSLSAARSPLGQVQSRKVASATFSRTLPGAPDGQYVVFQFDASFERKVAGIETVTAMLDTDGIWRVAGYYIK